MSLLAGIIAHLESDEQLDEITTYGNGEAKPGSVAPYIVLHDRGGRHKLCFDSTTVQSPLVQIEIVHTSDDEALRLQRRLIESLHKQPVDVSSSEYCIGWVQDSFVVPSRIPGERNHSGQVGYKAVTLVRFHFERSF